MGKEECSKTLVNSCDQISLSKAVQPYQIFLFLSCKETLQLLLIYWFTLQIVAHAPMLGLLGLYCCVA